jgi:hypothetical protein
MNTKIMDGLKALGACPEALRWAEKQKGPGLAWKSCARGDWMLWLLGRQACPAWSDSRKPLVLAACECARLALPYTKDPRVFKCIETAEAWTRGEATVEEARKARDAAYSAAADAAFAAAYAADAAFAAAYSAAADAAFAAAFAAAYAADAAFAAAYAAAAAADAAFAAADARKMVLKQCADIVRKHYPKAPVLK